jgi:hypothetical protein
LPGGSGNSYTSSITVIGADVYVAGWYTEGGGVNKACYWKNNTRTDLPGSNTKVSSMTVVGSDVYVSGYNMKTWYEDYDLIGKGVCYWKNNTRIDLPRVASDGEIITFDGIRVRIEEGSQEDANSITVAGSDVYVAGAYRTAGAFIPCYWKNGRRIDLPFEGERFWLGIYGGEGTRLNSIIVVGSDVYVAGEYTNRNYVSKAQYWKNNTRTDLLGGKNSYANSIAVVGSDVYVSGFYNEVSDINKACYWKNNTKIDLPVPAGATNSNTSGIAVTR